MAVEPPTNGASGVAAADRCDCSWRRALPVDLDPDRILGGSLERPDPVRVLGGALE